MSEIKTFKDLEIDETFIAKLEQNQITVPTGVQKQAIPLIQQNHNLLFQSETGTGKTLAYALPLLNKIQTVPNEKKEILILVAAPTFELASQIKNQFKMVSDIKTALLIGGAPIKRQIETLKEKPSVVIGTPARLVELIHLKKIKLEGLQAIVLDEVDRLLSPELRDYTEELINCPKKDVQLIACSATISAATQKVLNNAKIKSDGTKTAEIQTLFLPPEYVLKKRITHI
ncbi:MAG: DEAD/DEAH box helicase, partial [Treponema sp.]|nr:DEAD/DEAH box helicase [Treponema sp.]